jgi:hypothetical protein
MHTKSENIPQSPRIDRPTLDWDVVEAACRRARVLRARAFAQVLGAPARGLRERAAGLRAPIDFEPIWT